MLLPLHAALVGGDARQRYLSEFLIRDGHTVTEFALSGDGPELTALKEFSCVVLPMPITRDGLHLFAPLCTQPPLLTDLLDALRPEQRIFGGGMTPKLDKLAEDRGLTIRDYLAREELAVANAVPTAEGAVQLAMEALPFTIHRSRVLIAGFGRVGQCTAGRFRALGAEVTVAARSPAQLALAESMGCLALSLNNLSASGGNWDLVVNTVPALIFDRAVLSRLGRPVLLELASSPGGFDREGAAALGLHSISAPGLPGRVAPATAGRILQTTLYHMLEEEGSL